MKTHELFAFLKSGYMAVSDQNPECEVFHSDKGLFQVCKLGLSHSFRPESYPNHTWTLKTLPTQP